MGDHGIQLWQSNMDDHCKGDPCRDDEKPKSMDISSIAIEHTRPSLRAEFIRRQRDWVKNNRQNKSYLDNSHLTVQ